MQKKKKHITLYKFKVQDSSFFNLGMVPFKMTRMTIEWKM